MPTTQKPKQAANYSSARVKETVYTISSVAMFFLSVITLFIIFYVSEIDKITVSNFDISLLTLIAIVILSAIAGYLFLDASNPPAPDAFLPRDRELLSKTIAAGNEQAVTQYLRLRNMRGITGFFQKLGLPGLPIATIFVTLLFTFLAVSVAGEAQKSLFDLAKLTLGAFIGSFVQRSIDPSVHPHGRSPLVERQLVDRPATEVPDEVGFEDG